ncbi:EF-hand calcium-binding domain-containing protein 1 [Physocladia obscura]|uniref:EF-hand calcium-binding domain-containing protein 1 n=1 Tax=Physocladia obscura TaxID=109957 RepID=A0AAD5T888_9FUNG|nr:EF-hand calcium-binding domain-containing protein 1 [Physocladia obscura]
MSTISASVAGSTQQEIANTYLRKHNIPETLQHILTALLHQRPDDPKKFIVKKLEDAKSAKVYENNFFYKHANLSSKCAQARGQSIIVFSKENLVALFKVFDITGKGHITLEQYKSAMFDIGAKEYNEKPAGYEKDRIMQDEFVNNALELETLTRHFTELAVQMDKIDRSRFRDLLADTFGVDDSLLMDRGFLQSVVGLQQLIHQSISVFRCFDTDADNYISFDEFMKGMSVFLKGRREERLKFCFRVYDLNGDRYISKEEMFQMLKNCLVKGAEEDEDGVKDLVDLVLKKLDEDRDGRVSEADWNGAIDKESLLLEAFGQCLPTTKVCHAFIGYGVEEADAQNSKGQHTSNRLELPEKPTGNAGPHPPSKHVHATKRNRRIVVAPAPAAVPNSKQPGK